MCSSDLEVTAEALHVTEDVLQQKYSYHFHQLPDASRADIINMINNYTREAILPPLVETLVRRQMIQDRKIEALVHLLESLLEEMRVASKSKKVEPILTAEEKSSKVNKAEIKGTGFQMKMV